MTDQTPLVLALAALKRNQYGGTSKMYRPEPMIFKRIFGKMQVVATSDSTVRISHPEPEIVEAVHLDLLRRELSTVLGRQVVVALEGREEAGDEAE